MTRCACLRLAPAFFMALLPFSAAAQDFAKLEADIAAVLKKHDIPGASIAVTVGDHIAWTKGFGVLEQGVSQPVNTDTLFEAASISKAVTALGVLRLVESRKLALDVPIAQYSRTLKLPGQDVITLRQLLSHTSGLSVRGFAGYPRGTSPLPTVAQILAGAPPANSKPVVLEGRPGRQYSYSGGGYTVIQQLVVDATGEPFPRAMSQLVLAPLGMKDSTFEQPLPASRFPQTATGHNSRARPIPSKWHVYPALAAAGLWTTSPDLARYVIAIQKAYSGRPGALIGRETAQGMLRAQAKGGPGLGLYVFGDDVTGSFVHDGSNNGFRCRILATKSVEGRGLVIMTNSNDGDNVFKPVQELVDAAFGRN
jgi:CubicO group peptidase (beta-lactamase class C family)